MALFIVDSDTVRLVLWALVVVAAFAEAVFIGMMSYVSNRAGLYNMSVACENASLVAVNGSESFFGVYANLSNAALSSNGATMTAYGVCKEFEKEANWVVVVP